MSRVFGCLTSLIPSKPRATAATYIQRTTTRRVTFPRWYRRGMTCVRHLQVTSATKRLRVDHRREPLAVSPRSAKIALVKPQAFEGQPPSRHPPASMTTFLGTSRTWFLLRKISVGCMLVRQYEIAAKSGACKHTLRMRRFPQQKRIRTVPCVRRDRRCPETP